MHITEFARQYVAANCPHNPMLMQKVYVTDVSASTLVWKQGEFLVEMYLMFPMAEVVKHSHPFENLAIHWSGKLLGRREAGIGRWLTDKDKGFIGNHLQAGEWHSFSVGDTGSVLYNVSKWDDPSQMDSATVKYIGEPLGPLHAEQLIGSVV